MNSMLPFDLQTDSVFEALETPLEDLWFDIESLRSEQRSAIHKLALIRTEVIEAESALIDIQGVVAEAEEERTEAANSIRESTRVLADIRSRSRALDTLKGVVRRAEDQCERLRNVRAKLRDEILELRALSQYEHALNNRIMVWMVNVGDAFLYHQKAVVTETKRNVDPPLYEI